MNLTEKFMFGCILLALGYSYFVYPVLLYLLVKFFGKQEVVEGHKLIPMTIVIAVHDEEKSIEQKLKNIESLEYPKYLLNVIVASDASTDSTEEIVRSYRDMEVTLVRSGERRGKEWAQKLAIENGDNAPVIVFTDAAVMIEKESLTRIANLFSANPHIGAISSVDKYIEADGEPSGEGLYVRYEMWLRDLESRWGGLVGLSGSFFAARREVCQEWREDIPSDFNVAIATAKAGRLAISDRQVVGVYKSVENGKDEFRRKVRTINRGITSIYENSAALWPLWNSRFGFQLFSHKIMRWLVPVFYLLAMIGGIRYFGSANVIKILTIGLGALMIVGLLGRVWPGLQKFRILRLAFFVFDVNRAVVYAIIHFLRGKRFTVWAPTKR